MPVTPRRRVAKANLGRPTASLKRGAAARDEVLEAIISIVESNAARISRLEDVFALQGQQREEVADALRAIRELLQQRRRSA